MRQAVLWGCLAAAVALVWPVMAVVHAGGNVSILVGTGRTGPSLQLLEREVPDLVGYRNAGHDGQQFYAIARHPFDPTASAPYLSNPAYRYRRIGFPLLGWLLAPRGGLTLILVLTGVSLASVGASAALLRLLPGAPRWLPVTSALSPGAAASLLLDLGDTLVLALVIGALVAAHRHRWAVAMLVLVAAALTRETALLTAFAVAATPTMPNRWRLASVAAPAAAVAGWALWTAHALGTSVTEGGSDQLSLPFVGWLHAGGDKVGIVLGFLLIIVTFLGAARASWTPIRVQLALSGLLLVCVSENVTSSWVNTSRVAITTLPLAAWAIATAPARVDA